MTIVTIGGNPHGCENPGLEFNFGNDVKAANTILHCGGSVRRVAPWVNEDTSYTYAEEGPTIKVYTSINSRFIIEDFICKLQILYSV